MNYVCGALLSVIIGLSAYISVLKKENANFMDEINLLTLSNTVAHIQIDKQNLSIKLANEKLRGYELKMSIIETKYQNARKDLKAKINKVKTCEDAMTYLDDMLKGVK
jgi:hypothetical protein|nr:MAG TPA_asm: hypothetical protein [Caudoviricetes sp.]